MSGVTATAESCAYFKIAALCARENLRYGCYGRP